MNLPRTSCEREEKRPKNWVLELSRSLGLEDEDLIKKKKSHVQQSEHRTRVMVSQHPNKEGFLEDENGPRAKRC